MRKIEIIIRWIKERERGLKKERKTERKKGGKRSTSCVKLMFSNVDYAP